jgi:hypothetical protein
VADYLRAAGTWTAIEAQDRSARAPGADPLYAVIARTASVTPVPSEL